MTSISNPETRPHTDEESPFHVRELFFSRTDLRGIIKGGNRVFRRTSGNDWDEIGGAPHKIIRHKDMPKAVFWLMWQSIQDGRPIGAYVKNRAKNGDYYWVFAIILPLHDEYISVRLKPTSPMFKTVQELYGTLRDRELSENVTPEQSADFMLTELRKLGFLDYASFMSQALSEEISARNNVVKRSSTCRMAHFVEMLTALETIRSNGRKVIDGFSGIEIAPKNLRIQATRLGQIATPLGVVSTNFDALATDIKTGIGPFINGLDRIAECLSRGLFIKCACNMLSEIIVQFDEDDDGTYSAETLAEVAHLKAERPVQVETSHQALHDVFTELSRFDRACSDLKRTLSGLSIMRVMSQIEASRIGDPTGSIGEIILHLHRFQNLTQTCLDTIETQSVYIETLLRREIGVKHAAA